ncbi:hypothetical protein ACROYT_G012637 [Oculina patagonica]
MAEEENTASASNSGKISVEDLNRIITKPAGGFFKMPSDAYNEVFDGIFLSEASTAMEEGQLQDLGITHVLNAAHGKKLYHVQTGPDYYCESGIIYHGVPAMDMFTFELNRFFDEACDFIGKAVGTKKTGRLNGKILVHCKEGVSRSASLVLAYLVRDQEMGLKDAVRLVRSKREISPNQGFLQQLIDYSYKLGRA